VVQSGKQCPQVCPLPRQSMIIWKTVVKFKQLLRDFKYGVDERKGRDCRSLKALLLVDFFSKNFDPVDIKSLKLNIEVYRCDYSSETRRSTTVTSSSISAFRYNSTEGIKNCFDLPNKILEHFLQVHLFFEIFATQIGDNIILRSPVEC
jgi:hypothetical protein